MKIKRTAIFAAVLCMVASMLAMPATAAGEQTSTEAEVEFKEGGSGGNVIVDPDEPDKENPDIDPPVGPAGSLVLAYAPSLDFGEDLEISGITKKYNATIDPSDSTKTPFLQVTDVRGADVGWKVTATAGKFTSTDAQNPHTINGAQIIFADGNPNSESKGMTDVTAPDASGFTLKCDGNAATTVDVFTASAGNGAGIWVNRWYPLENDAAAATANGDNDKVQLEILGGTAKALKYTCEITWDLHNTPN